MLSILKGFDNVQKETLQESTVNECPPMGMDAPMDAGAQGGEISIKLDDTAQMAKLLMAMQAVTSGSIHDMQPPALPAPEEVEMEDYENEPEEEYMGVDTMLPSGDDMHRKKDISAIRVKDPAVESIKDRLLSALNEKKNKKSTCKECGKPSYTTLDEEKQKGVDGKVCWKGYKRMGTKKKGGKTVDNCVKM